MVRHECATVNYCYDVDCSGHGRCVNRANGYRCECDPGYSGTNCDRMPCVDGLTCRNNGVCT